MRVRYLDGLRGLAAVQVVLCHYALTFSPNFSAGKISHFFVDGTFAVYVFFLISGFVLTMSFENSSTTISVSLKRRFVRLAVPMSAGTLIAALVIAIFPDTVTNAVNTSKWLSNLVDMPGMSYVLADATGLSIVTGYSDTTIFEFLASRLPLARMPDLPTWSMHWELWGSIVIMLLVSVRRVSAKIHLLLIAITVVFINTHPLELFIHGHMCCIFLRSQQFGGMLSECYIKYAAVGLLTLGIAVDMYGVHSLPYLWRLDAYSGHSILKSNAGFSLVDEFSSVAVFSAVLLLPLAHWALESRVPAWLGRMSFSVYLVHWPVLCTLSVWIYLHLKETWGQGIAIGVATVVGIGITLLLAVCFERIVDRRAVLFSRALGVRSARAA